MKPVNELLFYFQSLDVRLWVDGAQLHYSAPQGTLTPTLKSQLIERKSEIIEFLQRGSTDSSSDAKSILPISRDIELPLSFAQQRLWFLQQLEPDNPFYNENFVIRLTGVLNLAALEQSLKFIVQRHESLRTAFKAVGEQTIQVIAPELFIDLLLINLQNFPETTKEAELQRLATEQLQNPFDLAQDSLVRWMLLKLCDHEHVLLVTMHHIVFDGWSVSILLHELSTLYQAFSTGKPALLPELSIQYADFAVWQRQQLKGEKLESELSYWKQQLNNAPPLLQLPTDRPRPLTQTYQGTRQLFQLSKGLTKGLKAVALKAESTLFMTLLAAFKILLYRYTNQEDIIVGSAIANRNQAEIEGLIGFFLNTLVLRTDVSGNPTFEELLGRVRKVTIGAYANQDLPFEKLVEELQPERDANYNPLFQVSFALQNTPSVNFELPGLTITPYEVERTRALFDLHLDITETDAGLECFWEYSTDLFDAARISRMSGHFQTLLEAIAANPQQQVSQLPLLTEPEQHQLVVEWNQTQIEYPKALCFHQLFESQVESNPDAVAVVFEAQQLTYRELNQRANQLAHYLNTLGVKPETLVGVCVERSFEMVIGVLGILKAGGAYVPLDPAYPQERLAYMLADSQVSVLLTTEKLRPQLPEHSANVVELDTDWASISQANEKTSVIEVRTENLAYVIYTSGSTGKPKGVLVTHQGLCNLAKEQIRCFQVQSDSRVLQFASLSFDASIWEIVMALGSGATLCLGSSASLLPGPALMQLLRDQNITHMTLPPTALAVLPTEALPALQTIIVAGEACSPELVAEWSRNHRFFNAYGPTESTVCATVYECRGDSSTIPIGCPIANSQVYLLDSEGQPVPVGIPGELHIGGVGLARGYLNQPELTAEKFIPNSFHRSKLGFQSSKLYKTGDLARYLPDGNVEFLGRIDHQVKVRGFRIELGEIEAVLNAHRQIQKAIVISSEELPGNKFLVAYVVTFNKTLTAKQLREFLKQRLPEYMVPNVFITLDDLPLTPNGKIDRKALPSPDSEIILGHKYIEPRTPSEEIIANIFAALTGVQKIGIHDSFFELGGHSLLATQLISRLRVAFDVEIPLRIVFESPTVAQLEQTLIQLITTNKGLHLPPIQPRIDRKLQQLGTVPPPLSFSQQRLWFLQQVEPNNSFYNEHAGIHLVGALSVAALGQSLNEIIQRHEVLRTTFEMLEGQPVQIIAPDLNLILPVVDLRQLPEARQKIEVQRLSLQHSQCPFNLVKGPLLRFKLLQLGEQKYILLFAGHHVIADGWSVSILLHELSTLYQAFSTGKPALLPELSIQYADFAVWQRQQLKGEKLESELSYWKQQLNNAPPLLQLPTDRPRPLTQTYQGTRQLFQLSKGLTKGLKAVALKAESTLFMTLLAAFKILLYRYTNQEDIIVGSAIANRNQAEIEGLIGFFLNTLVLRTDVSGNPTFEELLGRVRKVTIGAYANQDLPFEKLVEELQPERDASYNPLFQVSFALQNTPSVNFELPGLTITPYEVERTRALFDLHLDITETDAGLECFWEYSTDLFDAARISRMSGHFQTLLEAIAANPQQQVSQLPLLTEPEQHQLVVEWNQTQIEYPKALCFHQLFESQVESNPDAVAVVFEAQQLTYRELNQRANQLAHYLNTLGVKPETLVGVCVERSFEMVIGVLGILKAGGAYVPLDPAYPQERLAYMLADSQVSVLLTTEKLRPQLPEHSANVVELDTDWASISQANEKTSVIEVRTENLAYVIYTSGSTGKPKGVLVTHQGLCNLAKEQIRCFQVQSDSRVLQFASLSFDASIWEIVMALGSGATLCLGSSASLLPGPALMQLLRDQNITHMTLPPTALAVLPTEALPALQTIIVAGEACSPELVAEWSRNHRFFNAYGPTESTVCATVYECRGDSSTIPIGCPIANSQVYLLDSEGQPVPVGIPGELHIGGVGLARGYLNQPELTAEKFIPNSFHRSKLGFQSSKLYKTGDLARYLPDGNVEFLGRIDHQVKVRGFRIELGEIEAALAKRPDVQETVVLARKESSGSKRIVAYVVPNLNYPDSNALTNGTQSQTEQILSWQEIFNETYSQPIAKQNPTFNIIGWDSSYTGQPIPENEMAEWVDCTVNQILSRQPQRVLEIGCGTGLLCLRIAPNCSHYLGTDISQEALDYIDQQIRTSQDNWSNVTLCQKAADDFEGIERETFDAVILNSVVQYFPSIDYLLAVLEGAVKAVKPGGFIFIGDVRSLPLLEALHADIELYKAPPFLTVEQLCQRTQRSLKEEQELVVDPAFFTALKQHIPQISQAQIQLKRGCYHNELTQFRYEVIIQVEGEISQAVEPQFLDWRQDQLTLPAIHQFLVDAQPERLVIQRVPNARVQTQVRLLELLNSEADELATVGDLQEALKSIPLVEGIDPEDFWDLGNEFTYDIHVNWSDAKALGCYDVILQQASPLAMPKKVLPIVGEANQIKPWRAYGNNPLQGKLIRQLGTQLRGFLKEVLPDHMIPSAFVILEALPLMPNGKINRQALPAPDEDATRGHKYVAPRTPGEEIIANIFATVLGVQKVGIHDNFFEFGGHSLLATQLISRLRVAFDVEVPLKVVFESPTVAQLEQALIQSCTVDRRLNLPLIQPRTDSNRLSLSWAQERLWFLNQLEGASSTYNMSGAIRITSHFDVSAFEQALSEIIRRHEVLRTSFLTVNGAPIQVIHPEAVVSLNVVDLQGLEIAEREAVLTQHIQQEATSPFDLELAPLIRCRLLQLDVAEYVLLVTMHHIVSDGWSMGILSNELSTLYQAFNQGESSPLSDLPIQYADFAVWQRQWLSGEILQRQLNYWEQQLNGIPELLQLPTDYPRPSVQTHQGAVESFTIDTNLSQKLQALSQKSGITLFMTLLAAYAILLHRYTGQKDILIGSPIANRNRSEIEALIGFFVNTLVLRVSFEDNPSLENLLIQVRETTLRAYEHQDVPFEQVVEALQPQRSLSHSPLFQVVFILQNAPMGEIKLPGVTLTQLVPEKVIARFDLTLSITETSQGLVCDWEYSTDLFDAARISRMSGHFQTLLEAIAANPQQQVSQLPLLTEPEQHQLVVEWNQTQIEYPKALCFHQLFESQVESNPDAVAVVFEAQQLTYRELNQRANQLAHYLNTLGVKPETLVGVCVERSFEMVIGVLGILKAGGAYVPLDPAYPQERLAYMLADSQVSVLLTTEKLRPQLPEHSANVVELDTDWASISQANEKTSVIEVRTENLAYVIYTSGSTGKPKGVLVTHQGLCNLAKEQIRCFQVQSDSRVLQFASLSFDASIWEIVMALGSGATLCLGSSASLLPGPALMQLLRDQNITHMTLPPTALAVLPTEALPALQTIIVAGEACSPELVAEWSRNHRFFNAYGPTESTVCATVYECRGDSSTIPIGCPIANSQVYLLDSEGQPVPVGIPGELHIGGVGLARGYLNQPELTAEKFIPNSFHRSKLGFQSSKLYKTGDLARYLPDGNVEFLGRIDHQVKVRGFRIELGEIEAALLQHSAINEVVVLVQEDYSSDGRILAYLVFQQEQTLAINQLQNFLGEKLPSYMMPSAFVVLDAIPLMPNGKVDRNALPVPEGRPQLDEDYVMPQTETERVIAAVWQDLLQLEKVGINDNFFSMGGHSLLLVKVQAKLNEILDKELSVVELFKYPTIKELAQYLTHKADSEKAQKISSKRIHDRANRQKEAIRKQKQLLKQQGRKANG